MTCTIRQVDAAEARAFWLQQDDARIFLHPDVLEPLCARVDWWMADWNTHPVCLWPVCQAFDGSFRPPELAAYVGPLWDDSVSRSKAHRWWTITGGVQDAMIAFLARRYDEFHSERFATLWQLTLDNGYDHLECELQWTEKAIEKLRRLPAG